MMDGKQAKDSEGNSIPTNDTVHIAKQTRKTILMDNDSNKVSIAKGEK